MKFFNLLFFLLTLTIGQAQQSIKSNFLGQEVQAQLVGTASPPTALKDAEKIQLINNLLMKAERTIALLDVYFTMDEEPIQGDLFLFQVEAEEAMTLQVELLDEEGIATIPNCTFSHASGSTVYALDVGALENGTYYFLLSDQDRKELNRKVFIDRK